MEDNIYCIVLNIMEGIGFNLRNSENFTNFGFILKVSLNGEVFEVDGHFVQSDLIVFNSNCIWECELDDAKRIKTDNRPIRLECFFKSDNNFKNGSSKHVGSLLLPLRGVKIFKRIENLQIKPYWYKLANLNSLFRQNVPQIQLMLGIFKKTVVKNIHLDAILDNHTSAIKDSKPLISSNLSETSSMLQPQHGIFVELLEEIGQIQVGNDPLVDCESFCVTLIFRQIKNVLGVLNKNRKCNKEFGKNSFVFQYDFMGSISNIEIITNTNDCYTINQKISLNFRSSLKSLLSYFQRVFYIPLKLFYINDVAIAKYYLDISPFIPDDRQYFTKRGVNLWTKYGSFRFDIPNNTILSARTLEPSVEFLLTLELLKSSEKGKQCKILTCLSNLQHNVTHKEPLNQAVEFEQKTLMYETEVKEYLQLQQSAIEPVAVKYINTIKASEINIASDTKSFRTVAVNTEESSKVDESEKLYLYFLQQFKSWKKEQLKYSLNEFAPSNYMQNIQAQWEQHKKRLISRLETKIIRCDQLFSELENIQIQLYTIAGVSLKNVKIAENISQEVESNYTLKTTQLEGTIKSLKIVVKEKELRETILSERIKQLEILLSKCQRTHLSLDQLNDVLNDMRNQANRFAAIENFYREQCLNNMKQFKIEILKLTDVQNNSKKIDAKFCFDEIFNEEEFNFNENTVKYN